MSNVVQIKNIFIKFCKPMQKQEQREKPLSGMASQISTRGEGQAEATDDAGKRKPWSIASDTDVAGTSVPERKPSCPLERKVDSQSPGEVPRRAVCRHWVPPPR